MGQADEIRALAQAAEDAGVGGARSLAERILTAQSDADWDGAVADWLALVDARPGAFARAVTGIDLGPELTDVIRSHLLDPGGAPERAALGPVSLSVDSAPAIATRGAASRQPGLLPASVLGVLDFQRSLFALDAALVDSHAFGIFRVSGSAAARISWGARPYSVLSIGGFFPGFNPEPAQIPPLDRLALALESPIGGGYPPAPGYPPLTSNTNPF